jgi:hypothetical protein
VWRSLETLATIGFIAINGTWLIFSQLRPAEFSTRRFFHRASLLARLTKLEVNGCIHSE